MKPSNTYLVMAALQEFGTLRLKYSPASRQIWRRIGLTLTERDRSVECLVAQGYATFRLSSKGVDISASNPDFASKP